MPVGVWGVIFHCANALIYNRQLSTTSSDFIIQLFPLAFWYIFKEENNGKVNTLNVLFCPLFKVARTWICFMTHKIAMCKNTGFYRSFKNTSMPLKKRKPIITHVKYLKAEFKF